MIKLYLELFRDLTFSIRKYIFENSRYGRCISYECYLIYTHPIDVPNLEKAMNFVRNHGSCTFYSEVFKREITMSR